jgi:hypothetical protein
MGCIDHRGVPKPHPSVRQRRVETVRNNRPAHWIGRENIFRSLAGSDEQYQTARGIANLELGESWFAFALFSCGYLQIKNDLQYNHWNI